MSDYPISIDQIRQVKRAYENMLLGLPNVVGVGIGLRQQGGVRKDTPALVVMVTHKLPPSSLAQQEVIPAEIEGVPVDVQEVGEIRAQ